MSLDEKIRDIQLNKEVFENGYLDDEAIAQIKQTFQEEGYIHINASQETQAAIANTMLGNKVMTGTAWLDRFGKLMNAQPHAWAMEGTELIPKEWAMRAAQRASGLKES